MISYFHLGPSPKEALMKEKVFSLGQWVMFAQTQGSEDQKYLVGSGVGLGAATSTPAPLCTPLLVTHRNHAQCFFFLSCWRASTALEFCTFQRNFWRPLANFWSVPFVMEWFGSEGTFKITQFQLCILPNCWVCFFEGCQDIGKNFVLFLVSTSQKEIKENMNEGAKVQWCLRSWY